jgi:VanZ family protein
MTQPDLNAHQDRRGRFIRYAPLVLWIAVIFYFSSGQASMSETSRFLMPILRFLFPAASEASLVEYHGLIRKFAHFAEYALLAYFAARAFLGSHYVVLRRLALPAALLLASVIAVADEVNQSFEPSRTSSGWDVALDAAGATAAVLVVWFLSLRRAIRGA